MEQGNSVLTDPKLNTSPEGDVTIPETSEAQDPAVELATIKERYAASSREGQRLARLEADLTDRLKRAEDENRSLKAGKEQPTPQRASLPTEHQFVAWAVENEMSEKEARAAYQREVYYDARMRNMESAIQAQANIARFEADQREKGFLSLDPLAKQASEFFKEFPEIDALPISEKTERYKKLQPHLKVQSEGRDLSAVKAAASSPAGSGGNAKMAGPSSSDQETTAKGAGFTSFQSMEEARACKTQADFKAWKTKWKIK